MLKYRVYIVDEVHMLSGSAFNALLKTLEEPPEHVIFILATTELQKLPATIISRCQRFDFRRISIPVLTERLMKISNAEGFNTDEAAARLIARLAQGGMRDAISLLDLCSGSNKNITVSSVEECSGITGRGTMVETVRAIADKNYDRLFATVAEVVASSKDLTVFWQDLIAVYRDLFVIKTSSEAKRYLDLTDAETEELASLSSAFTKETLLSHTKMLDSALSSMQRSGSSKRMIAEMALIKMCDETLTPSYDALLSRLSRLEDAVRLASVVPAARVETAEVEKTNDKPAKKEPDVKKAPVQKPAETQETPKKAAADKPSVKPLRCKMEVAEKMALTDIPASSFLKSSRMYEDADGKIMIKTPNSFAVMMLSRQATKDALKAALSSCLMREISDAKLVIEELTRDEEDKYDLLDELAND